MAGSDFVFVQLTPFAVAQAGGHPMRVSGRTSIEFKPGEAQRVARFEWDLMLSGYETAHGNPLFELVPDPAASPVSTSPAETAPTTGQKEST